MLFNNYSNSIHKHECCLDTECLSCDTNTSNSIHKHCAVWRLIVYVWGLPMGDALSSLDSILEQYTGNWVIIRYNCPKDRWRLFELSWHNTKSLTHINTYLYRTSDDLFGKHKFDEFTMKPCLAVCKIILPTYRPIKIINNKFTT